MTAFTITITLMMVFNFRDVFSNSFFYEESTTHIHIQSDTVTSFHSLTNSFCSVSNNMTITSTSYDFTEIKKKTGLTPADISRSKCQRYLLCTGLDMQNGFTNLLYGGSFSQEREFPHMALIGYEYMDNILWNCGGSLISEKFVLTAAHCLKYESVFASMVKLGLTNIMNTRYLQEIKIDDIIHHPEYKKGEAYHDIGLLRLSSPASLNTYVKPVCLHAEEDDHLLMKQPVLIGWGEERKDSGRRPENLLKVELEFYDHEMCDTFYKRRERKVKYSKLKNGIMKEIMLCAGSPYGIKDPCQGDSGGPLQVHNGDTYVLVGVTSYGKPCGFEKNSPAVYTRVSSYLQWIVKHVWPETMSETFPFSMESNEIF